MAEVIPVFFNRLVGKHRYAREGPADERQQSVSPGWSGREGRVVTRHVSELQHPRHEYAWDQSFVAKPFGRFKPRNLRGIESSALLAVVSAALKNQRAAWSFSHGKKKTTTKKKESESF